MIISDSLIQLIYLICTMITGAFFVFGAGILECFLSSIRYKFLQKNKKVLCFSTSFIFNIVYIYVLAMVLKNLNMFYIILAYTLGYALGDVLAITFNAYLEKVARINGKRWKRRLKKWMSNKK